MITIVELAPFLRHVDKVLRPEEREALIEALARDPELSRDIIRSTGGVRKLRWAAQGQGKSGGARVIYYYYNDSIPLFLNTIYAKSDKASHSQDERNQIRKLVDILESYGD